MSLVRQKGTFGWSRPIPRHRIFRERPAESNSSADPLVENRPKTECAVNGSSDSWRFKGDSHLDSILEYRLLADQLTSFRLSHGRNSGRGFSACSRTSDAERLCQLGSSRLVCDGIDIWIFGPSGDGLRASSTHYILRLDGVQTENSRSI